MSEVVLSATDPVYAHITSLIFHSAPRSLDRVSRVLGEMSDMDVHRSDSRGKIIVVFESDSLNGVTDRVEAIRQVPDVINVTLVYHQVEDAALLDQPVITRG
jgi:nitrate reductase NapD